MHRMKTPTPQQSLFTESKTVRVTVPVTPEVLEAFRDLSAVQGVSTGKAMGEWLADTLDGVRGMTELLAKARQSPLIAAREIHAYALGMTDAASELISEVRSKSRGIPAAGGGGGADAPGGIARRLPRSGKRPADPITPPVGNTGGKLPKAKGKPAQKARR